MRELKPGDRVERLTFVKEGALVREVWLPCRVERVESDRIEVIRKDGTREALPRHEARRTWR